MRVIETRSDGSAVVELSAYELGLIGLVGTEFTSGPFAPDDEDWGSLGIGDRVEVFTFFESLP